MDRKTLYFWLLQFLSLFVATNAGFNSTSDDCIDFALANVEELISTFRKLENPEINAIDDLNGDGMKLEAFGNLKSDWSRLQLLYDKLPEDSVIKNNFKHLIRLLIFAHDESAKFQDAFQMESTVSTIEYREDANDNKSSVAEEEEFLNSTSQNVGEILKTVLTTPTSVFAENANNTNNKPNFTATFNKSIEDDLDAVVTSNEVNSTEMTEKILREEFNESLTSEKNPSANIINPVTEIPSLNSMPSERALISTTEERNINYSTQPASTVDQIEQSFTTEKYSLNATNSSFVSTINPIILSIRDDRPATDASLPTNFTVGSINEEISTLNETQTQSMLNLESYSSRPRSEFDEYSVNAKSQSMINFTMKKNEENRSKNGNHQMEYSAMDSPENPSNITITIGKDREIKVIKNNETEVSMSDKSIEKIRNETDSIEQISSFAPTIIKNEDKKLSSRNNRTEDSIIEKSAFHLSAIRDSTESTFSVSPTIEQDGKIERTSVNNENENWYRKLTSKIWRITDSTDVTPRIDKNEDVELKIVNNQSGIWTSETSTYASQKITNSIENITSIAPLFEKNENINLTSKNNESKIRMTEKSSDEEWRSTISIESSSITIPAIQSIQDIEFPSENNDTKVSVNDKSIPNKNTTELIAKTKIIDAYNRVTQKSVSIESSTEGQESSTKNYAEKSGIYEKKNQINISKDSEVKYKTVITETVLITESNYSDNDNEKSVESTSKRLNDITTFTENSQILSHSDSWLIKNKPYFVKNPLNTGISRNNNIFRDYKHSSNDSVNDKNAESPQIVLYESGAGARTGSVWRPQLIRQPPPGNNIWNFDNYHTNVGPYRQPISSADDTRADIRKDEKSPTKFLSRSSRINSVKSRKRGSANADIEKQFRWFYRQGQMDPAHKSRDNESHNTKIKIQCKKAQRH